jgi:hypothetical protein
MIEPDPTRLACVPAGVLEIASPNSFGRAGLSFIALASEEVCEGGRSSESTICEPVRH